MDVIFFIVGTAILLTSGDFLVRAAISISNKLKISPMVVGLTVIAFGTSAPELLVGIQATWNGHGGLAIGNIIGSNIANVFLILGVPALILAIDNSDKELVKNYYFMLAAVSLFVLFLLFGEIGFWQGVLLIIFLILFLVQAIFYKTGSRESLGYEAIDTEKESLDKWKLIIFLVVGFVGLPLGAKILITSATNFAENYGVSEEVIGLTVVAVGTSLPELATAIAAAYRREANLLLGNVIGSNIFNILGIAGIASLIHPLQLTDKIELSSVGTLIVSSIVLAPIIIWYKSITRIIGIIFLLMYAGYMLMLF
jgi:cation:H+ antiporter